MLRKRHLTWNQKPCARLEACPNRINWSWCRGEVVCWNMFHSPAEEVSKIQLHKSLNRWLKPFLDLYRSVGQSLDILRNTSVSRDGHNGHVFFSTLPFSDKVHVGPKSYFFCWCFFMNLIYFLFMCVFHVLFSYKCVWLNREHIKICMSVHQNCIFAV